MEPETTEKPFRESSTSAQLVLIGQLRRQLTGLMHIDVHEIVRPPDKVVAFRGQIHGDTGSAFEQISRRFASIGYTAWLNDLPGGGHEVVATKGVAERKPERVWINVLLFLATLLSVLFIGAGYAMQDAGLATEAVSATDLLRNLYRGLPFAGTLMAILLAHELSHYFVARRYGSPVSLPYFIPLPVGPIGTLGAVIVQRAPMRNRRALFDIGIAGPLGGLILAIPLLILGLSLSSVGTLPSDAASFMQEGNSLLYVGLKYLVFGMILPGNGVDVWLHPVAFAAWIGLLVTMINLIPVGQLDGGHVAYALLGRRAWNLGYVIMGAMIVWGTWLTTTGNDAGSLWITWAFLNLFLNRRHPQPLDDATRLDWLRIGMGLLALVILVLLFMPAPLQIVTVQ